MARLNIQVSGAAGDFLNKIPRHKRGQAVSLIICQAINTGSATSTLSSLFTNSEAKELFGEESSLPIVTSSSVHINPSNDIDGEVTPIQNTEKNIDEKKNNTNDFKIQM